MMTDSEAGAAARAMARRLHRIADGGPGVREVHMVLTRYRVALANHADPHTGAQRWREFLTALRGFVTLYHTRRSPALIILEAILQENSELLATA